MVRIGEKGMRRCGLLRPVALTITSQNRAFPGIVKWQTRSEMIAKDSLVIVLQIVTRVKMNKNTLFGVSKQVHSPRV